MHSTWLANPNEKKQSINKKKGFTWYRMNVTKPLSCQDHILSRLGALTKICEDPATVAKQWTGKVQMTCYRFRLLRFSGIM